MEDDEIHEGAEGQYYHTTMVYHAMVGRHNFGLWDSKESAEKHIKANAPSAKPFEGVPSGLKPLPDDMYFIQPRCVFSHTKPA